MVRPRYSIFDAPLINLSRTKLRPVTQSNFRVCTGYDFHAGSRHLNHVLGGSDEHFRHSVSGHTHTCHSNLLDSQAR